MIEPPRPASIIAGITALVVFQTPVRLTASISSHCSSVSSQDGAKLPIPALATTMSMPPNSTTASATIDCNAARSRTST